MNKFALSTAIALCGLITSGASSTASALPGGTDNFPWKASADIINSPGGNTGIVVTGASYAQCHQRFQDAMASHAYYHGDIFGNIKNCSYKPFNSVIGTTYQAELQAQLKQLEDDYNIGEYEQRKLELLKNYEEEVEVLPRTPDDFRRK